VAEKKEEGPEGIICSVCRSEFDLDEEGGTTGLFGILPVAFCPWCLASLIDMVQQGCPTCQDESESIH